MALSQRLTKRVHLGLSKVALIEGCPDPHTRGGLYDVPLKEDNLYKGQNDWSLSACSLFGGAPYTILCTCMHPALPELIIGRLISFACLGSSTYAGSLNLC